MEITCPKCKKPSKHNEAFLGPKGSILRCGLCGGLIKIFNRGKSDEIGPAMWVVRKRGGEVVQVDRLSTLQKWLLEGSVKRTDELLQSGKGWLVLENVPELSGLLYLARLDEDARRSEMWKMPTLNIGTEAPAPPVEKKPEGKPKEKKEGADSPDDEDTVQIPGKVLEESIKLSEADEIITAEILLLDEADKEEVEADRKKEADWDAAPMMLTDVVKPEKPKPQPQSPPAAVPVAPGKAKPRLEPVAEPPEPEKPVLEIAGEVTDSPWTDEDEAGRKDAPIEGGRRGAKLALQITLVVVLALVAGAAYVHRDRIYAWRHIFFPPADQEATGDAAQVTAPPPDETQTSDGDPADAAAREEAALTASSEGEEGGETLESSGKGGLKGYEEHFKKALALQHAEDCGRAVEFYRKAIEIDHRHAEAWTGIGECYEELGKNLNAVNSFKSALHYNSKYGPALLGLADILKKQGKLEAALDYYTRYLETSPGGSRVASVRKTIEEIKSDLEGGGASKKDPIGIPENPYGP